MFIAKTSTLKISVFFGILFFWSITTSAQCDRKSDSLTLVSLYHATDGPNWLYTSTTLYNIWREVIKPIPNAGNKWNFDTPINRWHGVELDSQQCLSTLMLYQNGLKGFLPPSLGDLKHANEIYLNRNELTGTIPYELEELSILTILNLSQNDLEGCIPEKLIDCENTSFWEEKGLLFFWNNKLPFYGQNNIICSSIDSDQIGARCSDGNSITYDDKIQEDCSCEGKICFRKDSISLLKLFESTNGQNWTYEKEYYNIGDERLAIPNAKQPWSPDLPIREWYGIEVNSNGCVESIYLNENNLDSIIPPIHFPMLKNLVISGNNLTGELPKLDSLPQLEHFNCSNNLFKDTFPNFGTKSLNYFNCSNNLLYGNISEANLPRITYFDCSNNQFTGSLPSLSNPSVFICKNNQFSGDIPSFPSNIVHLDCSNNLLDGSIIFSGNPDLRIFRCQNNQLTGKLGVFNFRLGIKEFDCSSNNLRGDLPDFVLNPSLTTFDCSNNQFEGGLPQRFFMANLEKFDCSKNKIKGSLPNFYFIPKLEEFDCSNNQITGHLPEFENKIKLQRFDCSNNQISGQIPSLESLTKIQYFNCSKNNLAGYLPPLNKNHELETFICSSNSIGRFIPRLDSLPNLKNFDCSNNFLVGEIPLLTKLPNLEKFNCGGNLFLEGSIPKLIKVPNLTHFDCSGNTLTGNLPDLSYVPLLRSFHFQNNFLTGALPNSIGRLKFIEKFYGFNNQLEGCYPSDLDNLCRIGSSNSIDSIGYNLKANPLLPWQGNLQSFCNSERQYGSSCDDGDPQTEDDIIQNDCTCRGTITSGLSNKNSPDILLYPNPTDGLLNLPEGVNEFQVFNTIGNKVQVDFQKGNLNVDFGHLQSGIYFLKIEINENQFLKKIIVK